MGNSVGLREQVQVSAAMLKKASRLKVPLAACLVVFTAFWRERTAELGPRRVWGELSFILDEIAHRSWLVTTKVLEQPDQAFLAGSVVAGILGLLSLLFGWRRGLVTLLWVLAAVSVAAGQRAALSANAVGAAAGYGVGLCLAVVFGWWVRRRGDCTPEPMRKTDYPIALWLLIIALFLRLWALDELPSRFEGEMGLSMLAGSSWHSLVRYSVEALTTVSVGCAHLLAQWAAFVALGDSVFALRASAVAIGVATVWNLFWLMRQHVGRQAAWAAALLAACSAEQLYWSRSENSYFIAVCLASVVTARLTAWLLDRPSWQRAFVVAIWMGCSRLFYLAAVTLVAVPPLVLLHGIVFDAKKRNQYARILPVVVSGAVLWAASLSLVHVAVRGEWRWIHPALHGELMPSEGTPTIQRVRDVGRRIFENARQVMHQWTVSSGFSQWYQRETWPYPPTILNVGIVGAGVLGLGIALGQWRRTLPGMLLIWFAVGCAPALLSIEPAERRMAAAFPAFYAIAGYGWHHVVSWIKSSRSRFLTPTWCLSGWVVLITIAASSASSHLRLPKAEVSLAALGRATREIFRSSDAVYYEMDEAALPLVVMVHSSVWRQRLPCMEALAPISWLTTVLERPCSFSDPVWRLMASESFREKRQAEYSPPRQWSIFLAAVPDAARKQALLRKLFPQGREHWVGTRDWSFSVTLFTVSQSDLEALQHPEISAVPLFTETQGAPDRTLCKLNLRGAVFVPREGWYRWQLPMPSELESWRIGDVSGSGPVTDLLPLTSGFHLAEWEGRVPCNSSLALVLMGEKDTGWRTVPAWSSWLAQDELTRAAAVAAYEGYAREGYLDERWGEWVDAGAAQGNRVEALVWNDGSYEFLELDADGQLIQRQRVERPGDAGSIHGFVPGPQGYRFVQADSAIWVTDGDGRVLFRWPRGPAPLRPQVVWWNDGQSLLAATPSTAELAEFDLAGRVLRTARNFNGGERKFVEPTTIAYDPLRQRFAVAEGDGRVLLLRMRGDDPLDLWLESELRPPFSVRQVAVRVLTFDAQGRLFVGDPERPQIFVYDEKGRRLMAKDWRHDLQEQVQELGVLRRIVPLQSGLLLFGGGRQPVRLTASTTVTPGED